MIPYYFPVFTKEDILKPPYKDYESKSGKQKTAIGWLKELFLYHYIDKDSIQITAQDRKDYDEVIDKFKMVNKIKKSQNLHDWEDQASQKEQAIALNKLRKTLGYKVIEEI